jgi:para-nitrobenzyl esterase
MNIQTQTRPIVETASGRVAGAWINGVAAFKSIPYGASTAGEGRFQPPQKVAPWSGVHDATEYASKSPQSLARAARRPERAEFSGPPDPSPETEDCLALNVFTPNPSHGGKRPVMVWLHGGAFSFGSANTGRSAGDRIAAAHDVVLVSVNHRLNAFGHLYLGEIGGSDFADSGNVGILDLVLALQWVRDNIAAFGGDPANVTIFGVSGGGGKVSTLQAMPLARGLFHRAVVQSGAAVKLVEKAKATRLAGALMKELGIARSDFRKLQSVPIAKLLAAIEAAQNAVVTKPFIFERSPFRPVVDGRSLQRHPFDPDAPDISADIPLMIGDTNAEMSFYLTDDEVWHRKLDAAGFRARLKPFTLQHTERVAALYEKQYPAATPAERLITVMTDLNFGNRTKLMAERKAKKGKAPAWLYSFQWRTPIFDGRMKAPHGIDPPFVFNTLDRTNATDNGPQAKALAEKMCATWAAFARNGTPQNSSIPNWPAFSTTERATLIWDNDIRIDNNPRPEINALINEIWADITEGEA